jgi:hypothetical protein
LVVAELGPVTETTAFGTGAPLVSRTVPEIVPVVAAV